MIIDSVFVSVPENFGRMMVMVRPALGFNGRTLDWHLLVQPDMAGLDDNLMSMRHQQKSLAKAWRWQMKG